MGGGLVNENGNWRTANFNECDKYGALGDRLRVVAGAILYKNNYNLLIITSGGKGQLEKIPNAPTVSEINKKELIKLGVHSKKIIEENKSNNTYQQLQNCKKIIKENNFNEIKIISNKYHLPRIKAMIAMDNELKKMVNAQKIELQSAENILLKYDSENWQNVIEKAYNSEEMKERIALEEKGVHDIEEGRYKFK